MSFGDLSPGMSSSLHSINTLRYSDRLKGKSSGPPSTFDMRKALSLRARERAHSVDQSQVDTPTAVGNQVEEN